MKRFNLVAWVVPTFVSFAIFLLLSSVGPLSDNRSFTHHAITSLALALICGMFLGWSSRRTDTRQRHAIALDAETVARVDALLSEGKKGQAAKAVREATGADLPTAVDTVEVRRAQTSRLRYLGL